MRIERRRRSLWLGFGVAAALVSPLACIDAAKLAPAGSAITLFATATVLPVNGEADITALVIKGGQAPPATDPPGQNAPNTTPTPSGIPVNDGTIVGFSTTLGRVEPFEARTTNGAATVRLIGDGRSGTATVTAFSGSTLKTLEIKIGAAGVTRVVLAANPQLLPAGGGTTTITARAEDAQGNGLLGVPVNFASSTGFLESTSVLTNDRGVATTTLTTGTAASVVASVGSATGQTATINITVTPGGGN